MAQYLAENRMKRKTSTQFFAVCLIALASTGGCTYSETPYIDTCKSMTTDVLKDNNIEWVQVLKTVDENDIMKVDLLFNGQSGKSQTAACLYERQAVGSDQNPSDANFRGSPTIMLINGQRVKDEEVVGAAFSTARDITKQSYDQLTDSVRNATQNAQQARKNAIEQAAESFNRQNTQ